ncbi:protein kinase family protein [Methylophilaceae bacterium 11]|nr:protein kinase family protein [Methylophilaceae bacterium 11]
MSLHPNNEALRHSLVTSPLVAGRYENLELINWDPTTGQKRGCFSLVFKAYDKVDAKNVALKFYDLDPRWTADIYRRQAFTREHEILQILLNTDRCLQLASALETYTIDFPSPSGGSITVSCQYFAVDWIEDSIDHYFLNQQHIDAIEKLELFNEIVASVEALHRHEVFHRDLKADNLRAYQKALKKIVIAIDLGTAARHSSPHLQTTYQHSVGAPAYASIEALSGLAGHRTLAPKTDVYALGCLLFELFNFDYFYRKLHDLNKNYGLVQYAMASFLNGATTEQQQLSAWKLAISKFSKSFIPIEIDSAGSSAPKGIAPILNDCLNLLTNIDCFKRPSDLSVIRSKIRSAITCLKNERAYQTRLQTQRDIRRQKRENALIKVARLAAVLDRNSINVRR